jgi:hypothetical protein
VILYEEAEDQDESVEKDWQILQEALTGTAENIIPNEQRKGKKGWISDEILNLMEERRSLKNTSEQRYTEMDRKIKQLCTKRKEEWLEEKCNLMEQLERTDSRMVAEKIREITGKKRTTRSTIIKDKRGNILTERQEVLQRWEEYVGELYSDDRGDF